MLRVYLLLLALVYSYNNNSTEGPTAYGSSSPVILTLAELTVAAVEQGGEVAI